MIKLTNVHGKLKEYGNVPDLWYAANYLREAGLVKMADQVLHTWHMAHDLKHVIDGKGKAKLGHKGLPTIAHVIEIKRQIDLCRVQMTDGTFRFCSKAKLTPEQKIGYYESIRGDCINPFEQDAEAYAAIGAQS